MKRGIIAVLALALAGLAVGPATAQRERATPYWASIASGKAMMRTGPGRNYPGTWLYVRADLPVRVVETYPDWRKIEDPDGTRGWMLVKLLSDTRTALVRGDGEQAMHAEPNAASPVRYRAEPGVVGRIDHCSPDWCELDVGGRQGYIRTSALWGLDPGETID